MKFGFILLLLLLAVHTSCNKPKEVYILNECKVHFHNERVEYTNLSSEDMVVETIIHYGKYKHSDLNSYRISPRRTKVVRAPDKVYKVELRVCKGGMCEQGVL